MSSPLDPLAGTVGTLRELWSEERIEGADGARLVEINNLLGQARRQLDAATTKVAAEIARQSRPELGSDSLAKQNGFRNANNLLSSTLGTTNGEAFKLVQVGEATAPRLLLTGDTAPAKHPHVAEALSRGRIGTPAAAAIIGLLDRVALRAGVEELDAAEKTLVEQAPGLSVDQLGKLIRRAEAYLDPDGVEPREEELRAQRFFRYREDASGALVFNGKADPEHGAPIVAVLQAMTSAELGAQRAADASGDPDAPRRTVAMIQLDALTRICEHILSCDTPDIPLAGATVIVRLSLEDLEAGTGHAMIDGLSTPISICTARRMAADGGIIPMVLGSDSEILDWGREKRLFTKAQRRALCERDGGCAACGAVVGITKAHHIKWWARHHGTTDLVNGVLLCETCHHQIHDNGWDIRIVGVGTDATVWFIPPAHVDRHRTPRLGGRRRFDYTPAA
ncbi:HNH endonuclease [Microbacterium invictum]|nr:HNH endonuclease signature motif containing protein [Microbacterium invictum]